MFPHTFTCPSSSGPLLHSDNTDTVSESVFFVLTICHIYNYKILYIVHLVRNTLLALCNYCQSFCNSPLIQFSTLVKLWLRKEKVTLQPESSLLSGKSTRTETVSFRTDKDVFSEQSLEAAGILCVLQGCQRKLWENRLAVPGRKWFKRVRKQKGENRNEQCT